MIRATNDLLRHLPILSDNQPEPQANNAIPAASDDRTLPT
jgi:hypothetical protein